MFQVTDDILDIEGSEEKRGKKIGGDVELGKATYPRIHGMEKAKKLVSDLMLGCQADLAVFGEKASILIAISDYVGTRKANYPSGIILGYHKGIILMVFFSKEQI